MGSLYLLYKIIKRTKLVRQKSGVYNNPKPINNYKQYDIDETDMK